MKFSHVISNASSSLSKVASNTNSNRVYRTSRSTVPIFQSPLDPDWERRAEHSNEPNPQVSERILESGATTTQSREYDVPHFREHHESSSIELFYDLFFVANLTTFTSNHEIVDIESLKNYVGFFTLLWFTWLETSLFDVRFTTASLFTRICKAASFSVMTWFAICGSVYNVDDMTSQTFRTIAYVLMISRLFIAIQYAIVLWYVRNYKRTLVPLMLIILSLVFSAFIYFGTVFAYSDDDGKKSRAYIAWYVVVCFEATAVIVVSSIWKVLSFRRTHLVERVGLLTLIIMGEGIIGLTKSVAVILLNSSQELPSSNGTVLSAVLLIYFIWALYFDQINHDRFGTVRQQIWAILHFPLHVALLLTVEGSASLVVWNVIVKNLTFILAAIPARNVFPEFQRAGFTSKTDLVDYINSTIVQFADNFKTKNLAGYYNYSKNLTAIDNVEAPFGSSEFNDKVGDIVITLWTGLDNFVFENFNIEVPETEASETPEEKQVALFNVYDTVFQYFYISAGCFLLILAVMYWFGNRNKSREEWGSILFRVIAGIGIGLVSLTDFVSTSSNLKYLITAWHIPVVMLVFLSVLIIDNLLIRYTNEKVKKQEERARGESYADSDGNDTSTNGAQAEPQGK